MYFWVKKIVDLFAEDVCFFRYENVLLKHKYKCEQQEITSYKF